MDSLINAVRLLIVPLVIMLNWNKHDCTGELLNHQVIPSQGKRNCSVKTKKSGIEVDCSGLGLNNSDISCETLPLPDIVDCKKITLLNLANNSLLAFNFTNFSELKILNLTLNPVSIYSSRSFYGLDQVEKLYLGHVTDEIYAGWTYYEPGTFEPLISLRYLDLSHRETKLNHVMNPVLCSLQNNVRRLIMNNMHSLGFALNPATTKCFQNSSVNWLNMEENHINFITAGAFFNLRHLTHLFLKRNNIIVESSAYFFLPFMHNLIYLDMSLQSGRNANPFDRNPSRMFSSVFTLNITLWVLPNLQTLKLDFTSWQIFNNLDFKRRWVCFANNSLVRLEITYARLESVIGTIPCLYKLKYLDITGLQIKVFDPLIFAEMPALEILLAQQAIPSDAFNMPNASLMFVHNSKLKQLDLSQLSLRSIPLRMFASQHQLQILNLSGNILNSVKECYSLPKLTRLDVAHNQLTYLPFLMLKRLEKNNKQIQDKYSFLNLTSNPLLCHCETIDILGDFNISRIKISHLKDGLLTCLIATSGSEICPVNHALQILTKDCHFTNIGLLSIAFSFYCLSIIMIVFLSVLVNQKWKFRYVLYTIEQCLFKTKARDRNVLPHEYDAFISYTSRNRQWVEQCLVRNLEQCGYSLCLDYMHFIPGECIMDNIVSAVENSRHTLLVVTPSYIRSGWCDFEVRCAQAHHIRLRQSGIIAIVFPKVIQALKRHYRPSLSKLLDTVTYLEWPEDQYAKMVFWIRLKQALGRPVQNEIV